MDKKCVIVYGSKETLQTSKATKKKEELSLAQNRVKMLLEDGDNVEKEIEVI